MPTSSRCKRLAGPPLCRLAAGALALAGCLLAAPAARAQFIRPWVPPSADSLLVWSTEARARFETNQGDSAQGANYRAYALVGFMGRQLLRSLGRANMNQAYAIESVLDSLGLDTEVAVDPSLPTFVLLMVHDPFHLTAASVGFLYWMRQNDLRMQGVSFAGGHSPKMRVWWTAKSTGPYEWAILSRERSAEGRMAVMLLRLNENGYFWNLIQFEGNGPDLGERGEASLVDLNGDNVPEIVSWVRTQADSTFEECEGCPHLLSERTFTEHDGGYSLNDSRLVPTPYAAFVLFIRLLRENQRAAAARLLEDPAKLAEAAELGWGKRTRGVAWKLEYAEPGEAWPRWLAMRFVGGKDAPLFVVHLTMKEDRWVIHDWIRERSGRPAPPAGGRQP